MKFKSLPFIAAAAMLSLASCSSDEPANNGQGENGGESYITLSINLPTQVDSRATDQSNDQFEDGLPSEYAVNNAYLLIFHGTDEATAILKSRYTLDNLRPWNQEGTSSDNVTTKANTVQKIQDAPQANLWALVILNYQGTEAEFNAEFKLGAGSLTFSDLYGSKTKESMHSTAHGIFMCNAPLYKNSKRTTLVPIAQNQIYTSAAEAQASKNPLQIYVERGVAKVNVTTPATDQEITLGTKTDDNPATDVTYVATVTAWKLDLTNKTSYFVRNTTDFETYKDYASAAVSSAHRFYSADHNRIYWAKDPNYTSFTDTDFNKIAETDVTGNPDYEYALENTFDVANQRQNRTTRAVIKATFAPKGKTPATFYTIGKKGEIYDKAGMQALIKAQCIALFPAKNDGSKYTFAASTSVTGTAGSHSIQVGDVLYDETALTGEEIQKLNDAIGTINTYKDGICYYVARVQHFGETYTPWNVGDKLYGETENAETAAKNYLGRYGMVRNNWYELQITEIKKLGNPVVPEPTGDPDDENEYYMNFNVNIHAWAKRVQNVKL